MLAVFGAGCSLIMGDVPPKERSSLSRPDAGTDARGDAGQADTTDAASEEASADGASSECDGQGMKTFYRDGDSDGYGDSATAFVGCEAPGAEWVTLGDDCQDRDPRVHPGQTEYFGTGYRSAGASGAFSFDYDCDGSETGAAGQTQAPSDCPGLLLCTGTGFEKSEAREPVPGVNPYCGSNTIGTCMLSGLLCQANIHTSELRYVCN